MRSVERQVSAAVSARWRVTSPVRCVSRRWKNRQCRSVQSIIGATDRRHAEMVDTALLLTSMRASEITSLRWEDYDDKAGVVLVRERKHPRLKEANDQLVPLLRAAVEIVERQPRGGPLIFPFKAKTFSNIFPRACRAVGVSGLRFHDLRHDGVSRLFELGYHIHEVALFSGHRDWKQLKRYTQLRPAELRRLA